MGEQMIVKQWICAVALLALGGAAFAQRSSMPALPDFGNPADAVLSKSQEAELGRAVMLQLRGAGAIVEDPVLTDYIEGLGRQLATHARGGSDQEFTFFVIDDDRINAFALPGGYIGINAGLITASDSESELAGVMAHEIAHVTQRHIARSIYDSQRTSLVSMAAMLAAIMLGAATDMPVDAMSGVVTATQAAAIQRQINFTRSNEYEADRVGIEILGAAGFNPHGMAAFFEKLSQRYGTMGQHIPELLRTHPVTTNRIAEARARARTMTLATPANSSGYSLAKARLRVRAARTAEAGLNIYRSMDPDHLLPADRYGMALAHQRAGQHDDAARIYAPLVREAPTVIPFRIGYAEALMASGDAETGMAVYQEAMGLFPRHVPLTISYAEALIGSGRPDEAHRILLDLLNNLRGSPTPEQIRLISRAANAEGNVAYAHYYMAEYHLSLGNVPLAVNQLRMALEAPDTHNVDRARFEARLDQVREWLPEERRGRGARDSGGPGEPGNPFADRR
jgi:beta-barrel assembly-enhancing protease